MICMFCCCGYIKQVSQRYYVAVDGLSDLNCRKGLVINQS